VLAGAPAVMRQDASAARMPGLAQEIDFPRRAEGLQDITDVCRIMVTIPVPHG